MARLEPPDLGAACGPRAPGSAPYECGDHAPTPEASSPDAELAPSPDRPRGPADSGIWLAPSLAELGLAARAEPGGGLDGHGPQPAALRSGALERALGLTAAVTAVALAVAFARAGRASDVDAASAPTPTHAAADSSAAGPPARPEPGAAARPGGDELRSLATTAGAAVGADPTARRDQASLGPAAAEPGARAEARDRASARNALLAGLPAPPSGDDPERGAAGAGAPLEAELDGPDGADASAGPAVEAGGDVSAPDPEPEGPDASRRPTSDGSARAQPAGEGPAELPGLES